MKKTLIAFAVASFAVSAYAQSSVTLGDNSSANQEGVAVGGGDTGWGPNGPLAGGTARLNIAGEYGAAFGYASQAQGRGDTAIGTYANTGAPSPLGAADDSQDSYRTAVGYKASATGEVALSLGSFTSATGLGSVALGYGSVATDAMSVSVGTAAMTRSIQNVTAGVNATDAVNVAQLQGVQSGLQTQITQVAANDAANAAAVAKAQAAANTATATAQAASASAASTAAAGAQTAATAQTATATAQKAQASAQTAQVSANAAQASANAAQTASTAETARAESAEVTLQQNMTQANAKMMVSANAYTSAISAQTLQQANSYTDQQFDRAESDIHSLREDMYGGVAAALSVAGLPQPTGPGRSMVSASTSNYHGYQGFAAGYSRVTQNDKWVMKAAVTTSTRGDFGAVVSAGYQF
jgi:trimeric autotransporter adhesin